jgi:hypothetical protein
MIKEDKSQKYGSTVKSSGICSGIEKRMFVEDGCFVCGKILRVFQSRVALLECGGRLEVEVIVKKSAKLTFRAVLPDLDSNQDKLNQNQLYYHYTIGQCEQNS